MTYDLIHNGEAIPTVDMPAITKALAAFDADQYEDNFVVLSPEPAIAGSIYLQSALISDPGQAKRYVIETRLVSDDQAFRHYSHETDSLDEVQQIFAEYFLHQQLPPLADWTDITQQFA